MVTPKRIGVRLAKATVRASDTQTVTVGDLAAGERLTVTYQGRRISPAGARASARGIWTGSFEVGTTWGVKTVRAHGRFSVRDARVTFQVVRRCTTGHVCP